MNKIIANIGIDETFKNRPGVKYFTQVQNNNFFFISSVEDKAKFYTVLHKLREARAGIPHFDLKELDELSNLANAYVKKAKESKL